MIILNPSIAKKLDVPAEKLSTVKNIIFDLGNVVIDIYYDRTLEAFKKLGFSNFEQIYTFFKQTDLVTQLEIGQISGDTFCTGLRKNGLEILTNNQIKEAWSAMIGELTVENYLYIKNLRKKFKTYLLSNTNDIHIESFSAFVERRFGKDVLPEMFDQIFYSHCVHMRKPDAEIYEHVISDAGLMPSETLFVDDLLANIEGARSTGILSYHLEKGEKIQDLFLNN